MDMYAAWLKLLSALRNFFTAIMTAPQTTQNGPVSSEATSTPSNTSYIAASDATGAIAGGLLSGNKVDGGLGTR
jgi:hypothetical protein